MDSSIADYALGGSSAGAWSVTQRGGFGIRLKLLLGFALVLLLTVLVGGIAIYNLQTVAAESGEQYEAHIVPLRDVALIRAALGQHNSLLLRSLLDPSAQHRTENAAAMEKEAGEFDDLL